MDTNNDSAFQRANRVMPGGVNSPVRAFGSVGGTPRFFASAHGPYVTDVEGRQYVDLVGSWGPAILGHAYPPVVEAVCKAAERGLSFGASTEYETELAELVCDRVHRKDHLGNNHRLIEKLRLVSTGTEATMTAIRLARGATGRDVVVKFSGHYHGHSDGLLADAGSGVATLALPSSAGVPATITANTLVVPYNDADALRVVFAEHGPQIAAVIVEAVPANMGVVAPLPGINAEICSIAHTHGALVILDEVITGFRVGPAGWWGIDPIPFTPDIVVYGKVIGGGLPLAALGGASDLMDLLAPTGPVYQAGTLSGNPVAVAAGIATLHALTPQVYEHLNTASLVLAEGVRSAFAEAGLPLFSHSIEGGISVQHVGNLVSLAFCATAPRNYADVIAQETFRYPSFFHAMLDAGVSLPPSLFETWFLSASHNEAALSRIMNALPAAVTAAATSKP